MYIALGQGQTTPAGQIFDAIRKTLPIRAIVLSFKKISLNSDFYIIVSSFSTCKLPQGRGR